MPKFAKFMIASCSKNLSRVFSGSRVGIKSYLITRARVRTFLSHLLFPGFTCPIPLGLKTPCYKSRAAQLFAALKTVLTSCKRWPVSPGGTRIAKLFRIAAFARVHRESKRNHRAEGGDLSMEGRDFLTCLAVGFSNWRRRGKSHRDRTIPLVPRLQTLC
jgi:hypothetical protein